MRRLLLLIAVASAACATSACAPRGVSTVPRRVDGAVVHGAPVSPIAYQRFIEAELAFARGDFEAALRLFEGASPSSDPFVLGRLAETMAALGRADEATRLIDSGLSDFPESEALWNARGRIHEAASEFHEALLAYERAMEAAPESETPALAATAILERQRNHTKAVELLGRYIARDPEGSSLAWWRYLVLLVRTRASDASIEEAVETLHRLAPRYSPAIRELAERLLANDRHRPALALLRPLPRVAADATTYLRALVGAGHREDALTQLHRMPDALVGGPMGRGQLLLELGRADMAAALAEAVVDAAPEPEALLLLGRAERAQGRNHAALASLRRVPQGSSGYLEAQIEMARTFSASGQSRRARRLLADLAAEHEDDAAIRAALEALDAAGAASRAQ